MDLFIIKNIFTPLILALIMSLAISSVSAQKKGAPAKIEIPAFIIDEETKLIVYKEVVQQEGTKGTLYDKAFAWANSFYKSPTNVLREKDKEGGKLMARHRFYIWNTNPKTRAKIRAGTVEYTLNFNFKEGKYKYEITKINHKQQSSFAVEKWIEDNKRSYDSQTSSYLVQIDEEINKIIKSFKAGIAKKDKVEEDW